MLRPPRLLWIACAFSLILPALLLACGSDTPTDRAASSASDQATPQSDRATPSLTPTAVPAPMPEPTPTSTLVFAPMSEFQLSIFNVDDQREFLTQMPREEHACLLSGFGESPIPGFIELDAQQLQTVANCLSNDTLKQMIRDRLGRDDDLSPETLMCFTDRLDTSDPASILIFFDLITLSNEAEQEIYVEEMESRVEAVSYVGLTLCLDKEEWTNFFGDTLNVAEVELRQLRCLVSELGPDNIHSLVSVLDDGEAPTTVLFSAAQRCGLDIEAMLIPAATPAPPIATLSPSARPTATPAPAATAKPAPPAPTAVPAVPAPTAVPAATAGPTPTATWASVATPTPAPARRPVPGRPAGEPPPMFIDPELRYYALIHLAKDPKAVIQIELYPALVPMTVNSFVWLAEGGFYDGVTFHRVIDGFMAQTGDPTGTGRGGPGYVFPDEFHPDLRHDSPGVVSMANAGNPPGGTNGSQFFITFVPLPYLDGLDADGSPKDCQSPSFSCHAVFGRVIEGMEYVEDIRRRDPAVHRWPGDAIREIEIVTEVPGASPPASPVPGG